MGGCLGLRREHKQQEKVKEEENRTFVMTGQKHSDKKLEILERPRKDKRGTRVQN